MHRPWTPSPFQTSIKAVTSAWSSLVAAVLKGALPEPLWRNTEHFETISTEGPAT